MMGSNFQFQFAECVLSRKHDHPRSGGRPALFEFTSCIESGHGTRTSLNEFLVSIGDLGSKLNAPRRADLEAEIWLVHELPTSLR